MFVTRLEGSVNQGIRVDLQCTKVLRFYIPLDCSGLTFTAHDSHSELQMRAALGGIVSTCDAATFLHHAHTQQPVSSCHLPYTA